MIKKVILKSCLWKLKNQLVDLFTKPLAHDKFNKLTTELGILDMKNVCWYMFGLLILLDPVCAAFKVVKSA